MTNQEAIEIIKMAIAEVEWTYSLDYVIAFTKAISALEKNEEVIPRIPKDPISMYNRECVCGHVFSVKDIAWQHPYCPCCGRLINWKDMERN